MALEPNAGNSDTQAAPAWVPVHPGPHLPTPARYSSRVKPAGSVNDVGLDALDLDRMKQVRARSSQQAGASSSQGVPYLTATKAGT